jgi:outer membrane protein assembly factor BamB
VQVVDASGDVRGEMPILPVYVRLTGDGRRIAMLHPGELVVLRRDGVLDWSAPVPIDALIAREGHSQLEAAGGRIVVSGTGKVPAEESSDVAFRAQRRGTLRCFTDSGSPLWRTDQGESDALWFQISLALSQDGETLATFHSSTQKVLVQVFDAATGETLWTASAPRRPGTSCLSVSADGQLVALTHADLRTWVTAWSHEGAVVWEGEIPYTARVVRVGAGGLLVADRWIVRLELAEA